MKLFLLATTILLSMTTAHAENLQAEFERQDALHAQAETLGLRQAQIESLKSQISAYAQSRITSFHVGRIAPWTEADDGSLIVTARMDNGLLCRASQPVNQSVPQVIPRCF